MRRLAEFIRLAIDWIDWQDRTLLKHVRSVVRLWWLYGLRQFYISQSDSGSSKASKPSTARARGHREACRVF